MSAPYSTVKIPEIVIKKGETLTVYLRSNCDSEPLTQIQVELRVNNDGIPEIFANDILMSAFEKWYPIRR